MDQLNQTALIALFLAAAGIVWWAGIHLARAVDALDNAFGWGQAIGGMVLLALVTNLPEIAIVASAAGNGRIEVATGNLLGGIAIQTVVLALLDAFGNPGRTPLATRAASPQSLLEALLVIAILALVIVGHILPPSLIALRVTPAGALIAMTWLGTLLLIRRMPAASDQGTASDDENRRTTMLGAACMFTVTALATLGAGVLLERTGSALAKHWHMQGAVFGATILAAATSMPELATGMASMRRKQYTLAVSDILGGNAFLPVLFVMASLLAGTAVLPDARNTDIYLTALGMLLTAVFMGGLLCKPARKILGMGADAWLMIMVYAMGMLGLFHVPG